MFLFKKSKSDRISFFAYFRRLRQAEVGAKSYLHSD